MGGTFVNAHHSYTRAEAFSDDLFKGDLLGVQNEEPVGAIYVRIRDDSPEDGSGGGALFASDILVEDLEGRQTRGSEIGFRASVEGGFQRRGYLSADGSEEILLTFDFSNSTYTGPDPSQIRSVTTELVLANDYGWKWDRIVRGRSAERAYTRCFSTRRRQRAGRIQSARALL